MDNLNEILVYVTPGVLVINGSRRSYLYKQKFRLRGNGIKKPYDNIIAYPLTHWPLGNVAVIFKFSIIHIVAWTLTVTLLLDEWHRN